MPDRIDGESLQKTAVAKGSKKITNNRERDTHKVSILNFNLEKKERKIQKEGWKSIFGNKFLWIAMNIRQLQPLCLWYE